MLRYTQTLHTIYCADFSEKIVNQQGHIWHQNNSAQGNRNMSVEVNKYTQETGIYYHQVKYENY